MKCPDCGFENPDGMKFCNQCGQKVAVKCPLCQGVNPPDSKFCGTCGGSLSLTTASLEKPSFDDKLSRIQKYLPQGLIEKILSQRDRIESEKKQVTVMFCDLEGYTSISEKLGPEGVYTLMDQVYEILIQKVNEYGGTVNELTGDGIMALFGAPVALEDAPQRAIRSALSIHKDISRFSERMVAERGIPPLRMRSGIHSGPVVVGTVGNDLRVDFKAIGDTVNLASRMESIAEAGTTYVTEDTFRLAEGLFRFENLGEREIKGKSAPVKVYRVLAPSSRRTRFDVSAERGLTTFVGRKRELEILLEGFERMKRGRGQVFSIVSEAGVGKSRFLYEFRKAVINENVTFLEGKCLSYGKGAAYHPIIDILKSSLDIQESDGDSLMREKVTRNLRDLGLQEDATLPCFLELLSVKNSGIEKWLMSPEGVKDRMIEAVRRIVLRGSEIRPLIIAIEDLHWVDKSSEDLLNSLLESIPGASVFLIFTYRPEYAPVWVAKSFHNQITLNPLSNQESLTMASHLLDEGELDQNLSELILEKTECVPFFIEEFIRSLKELKLIEKRVSYRLTREVRNLAIPSRIHDIIMARVDSLPESAKQVLQAGSVIEREFPYQLIRRIAGVSEPELQSLLSVLKNSELLFERGLPPQSTYIFRHNLTREVVYGSILEKKRRDLHESIGRALEELFREKIDEHCETLAAHFLAAGKYVEGAKYSRLASLKAEKSGTIRHCIEHAKRRVDALEKIPRSGEGEDDLVKARVELALYLFQMGCIKQAREAVSTIQDRVAKDGPSKELAMIYLFVGSHNYMLEEDYQNSVRHLEGAVEIAEKLGDFASFGFASYMLGLVLSFNCEFDRANARFQKLLDMSLAIQSAWRASAMKSNLGVYAYDYKGHVGMGYRISQDALQMAEESGDILSKAMAYTSHGTSCYYKGLLKEAEGYLLKGVSYSEKIELMTHSALAHQWLGHTTFDLGDYDAAEGHYRETILLREQSGLFPSSANLNRIALARARVFKGETDIDLEGIFGLARENKVPLYEGWVARFIGHMLMRMGNSHYARAEKWIVKAADADRKNLMKCDLGHDYALWSELLGLQGRISEAGEQLKKAMAIFEKCEAEGWSESTKHRFSAARLQI